MMQPGSTRGRPESVLLHDMTAVYGFDVSAHMFGVLKRATVFLAESALRWLSILPSMYMTGIGMATLYGSAATGATPLRLRCWASVLWDRMLTSICAPELWAVAKIRFLSMQ